MIKHHFNPNTKKANKAAEKRLKYELKCLEKGKVIFLWEDKDGHHSKPE